MNITEGRERLPEFQVQPEKMMLICPGCGDVVGIDPKVWSTGAIFANNPPVCSPCGIIYEPRPQSYN